MTSEPDAGRDAARVAVAAVVIGMLIGSAWLAFSWGSAIAGVNPVAPTGLPELITGFKTGQLTWPIASTVIFFVLLLVAVALVVTATILWARRRNRKVHNAAAARMAERDPRAMTTKSRAKQAAELHPEAPVAIAPGLVVGATANGQTVFHSWRQCAAYVMGPGTFKTTAFVVPHMLTAPAAAIVTSNKLDGIHEIIRGRRHAITGGDTFVFDPEKLMGGDGQPTFTFNPFEGVETIDDARQLVAIFELSTKGEKESAGHAQFDTNGRDLLAGCFLAAALEGLSIARAHAWVSSEKGMKDALTVLERHRAMGAVRMMSGILGTVADETRSGYISTAQRMLSGLANDAIVAWAVPMKDVPAFDAAEFVNGRNTLVLLSKAGGASGALMTTLVRIVCRAAEQAAYATERRRLPAPMVVELDECANVVKWNELPELFSYYGSLGIVVSAYFQSVAQAKNLFGDTRFGTLWDAANPAVYGGGSKDERFLDGISKLLGEYDELTPSTSYGPSGASTSTHRARRRVMSVAELSEMDPRHAIVLGDSNVLVHKLPFFEDEELKQLATATGGAS
ncbi:type IV secretory system conjugative DNA transfer family protein [Microbacteriaceae bacterium VKM Ac-2854]|nr:type IV secretory system conjugative DNA transfer family protein [Microbacteriaceae bacterium VKM Ac-2854]